MADREKVLTGLACCQVSMSDEDPFAKCRECPYNDEGISVQDCRSVLCADTLEVIKMQEQRLCTDIREANPHEYILGDCPNCGKILQKVYGPLRPVPEGQEWKPPETTEITQYCPRCGQAVKWNA